jgi:hypothetical protein
MAHHGVVGITANLHSGHLVLLEVCGETPQVACVRDIVVYEGDLVPAV